MRQCHLTKYLTQAGLPYMRYTYHDWLWPAGNFPSALNTFAGTCLSRTSSKLAPHFWLDSDFFENDIIEVKSLLCPLLRPRWKNFPKYNRYPRTQLLTSNDGSPKSSRELLFAITWYMRVTGCIDQICAKACEPVHIEWLLQNRQSRLTPSVRNEATDGSIGNRVSRLTSSICKLSLLKRQFIAASVGKEITSMKVMYGCLEMNISNVKILFTFCIELLRLVVVTVRFPSGMQLNNIIHIEYSADTR